MKKLSVPEYKQAFSEMQKELKESYKKQQEQTQDLVFKNAIELVKKTIIKTVQLKPEDVDDALIKKAALGIKDEPH